MNLRNPGVSKLGMTFVFFLTEDREEGEPKGGTGLGSKI